MNELKKDLKGTLQSCYVGDLYDKRYDSRHLYDYGQPTPKPWYHPLSPVYTPVTLKPEEMAKLYAELATKNDPEVTKLEKQLADVQKKLSDRKKRLEVENRIKELQTKIQAAQKELDSI